MAACAKEGVIEPKVMTWAEIAPMVPNAFAIVERVISVSLNQMLMLMLMLLAGRGGNWNRNSSLIVRVGTSLERDKGGW